MLLPWIVQTLALVPSSSASVQHAFGRRAAVLGAASSFMWQHASPAAAEASFDKAAVLQRASSGKLKTDLVIERAKAGMLVNPDQAGVTNSCEAYKNLKNVDTEAAMKLSEDIRKLRENALAAKKSGKLDALEDLTKQIQDNSAIKLRIEAQVGKIDSVRDTAECIMNDSYSRAAILERSAQGRLTTDRVIERAKAGKFFDSDSNKGFSCSSYNAIREGDQNASRKLAKDTITLQRELKAAMNLDAFDDAANITGKIAENQALINQIETQAAKLKTVADTQMCYAVGY